METLFINKDITKSMAKMKPSKPTQPYGVIHFSKSGKVKKEMFELSGEKEKQELGVAQVFVQGLKKRDSSINEVEIRDLPECDHDFILKSESFEVTLQITEIPERRYVSEISKEEYDSGIHSSYILKKSGEIPLAVNEETRDNSLKTAVEIKIKKTYSKSPNERLWLLVFTTAQDIFPFCYLAGKATKTVLYMRAYDYVSKLDRNPFDEIWFTNLLSRPIRIWPLDETCANK